MPVVVPHLVTIWSILWCMRTLAILWFLLKNKRIHCYLLHKMLKFADMQETVRIGNRKVPGVDIEQGKAGMWC